MGDGVELHLESGWGWGGAMSREWMELHLEDQWEWGGVTYGAWVVMEWS